MSSARLSKKSTADLEHYRNESGVVCSGSVEDKGLNFLRLKRSEADKPLGGRYQIIGQLGMGGFGQTFLAEDLHLPGHPRCVLKQLKPQLTDTNSLQVARRLFDTEAQVLYELGSHPQIPRLLAHFEDDQEFYLAQELIEGTSLTDVLLEGRPWPEAVVISILQDLLQTLTFVHQQNVIHRDIKPSNLIRRQSDGRIVLIDFGAVKQTSISITGTQSTHTIAIGTQGYMPHEQYGGHPRFSSDVYAVGMIGIQALTGIFPRNLRSDPHTGEVIWHSFAPQVSSALKTVLDRMVRYDFRDRYASAEEALAAFQALTAGAASSSPIQASPSPEPDFAPGASSAPPLSPSVPVDATAALQTVQPTPHRSEISADDRSDLDQQAEFEAETQRFTWGLEPPTAETGVTIPALRQLAQSPPPRRIQLPTPQQIRWLPDWLMSGLMTGSMRWPIPWQGWNAHRSAWIGVGVAIAALSTGLLLSRFSSPQSAPSVAQSASGAGSSSPLPSTVPAAQASSQIRPSASTVLASADAALLSRADQLRQTQQYPAAIQFYDRAIAANARATDAKTANPKVANAYWGKCYSLNQLQQYEAAIPVCDRALTLQPQYAEALWSKGFALEQQQNYQAALALYDRALQIKPKFADAWNNRGTALLRLQQVDEAIAAFDQATKLKPDLAEAWSNRGVALWSLQRYDQAIASVDRALQIQPDYADAQKLRQQMRQKLGR